MSDYSRAQLLVLLDEIKLRIEQRDSIQGVIAYEARGKPDAQNEFLVTARIRVGTSTSESGGVMLVHGPLLDLDHIPFGEPPNEAPKPPVEDADEVRFLLDISKMCLRYDVPFAKALELAKELFPLAKRVFMHENGAPA